MTLLPLWLIGWLLIAVILSLVWCWQLRSRNASVVDAFWPLSIGAAGLLFALVGMGSPWARWCTGLLAVIWALRLGGYLARRNIGHAEDARYTALREEWGDRANFRMLLFFQVQAFSGALLAVGPLLASGTHKLSFWQGVAGLLVGLAGILGEALADRQLARFKANRNAGRPICDTGLWRYSRHPNYFFESLYWCAWPILAWGAPFGWLALLSPILITLFLLRFTGVPATESHARESRGADYDAYIQRTSAFIPWFPKSAK